MTRDPHNRHPSKTLSSDFLLLNGLNSSPGTLSGHPSMTKCLTCDKVGSLSVHSRMFLAVIPVVAR